MKEHLRSSDLDNRRSKDSPAKKISKKIAQESLTEAFDSPIGDVFPGIYEDSIDFSSISAILDANYHGETAEISTANRDEEIDFSKTGSAEVEILVNHLKQARLQVLNFVDMENKSKKVLDALIEFIINEYYTLPQDLAVFLLFVLSFKTHLLFH